MNIHNLQHNFIDTQTNKHTSCSYHKPKTYKQRTEDLREYPSKENIMENGNAREGKK